MNMKLVSLAMVGALFVSGSAAALDCDPKFYVGAEGQVNTLRTNKDFFLEQELFTGRSRSISKSKFGMGGIIGTRITENFGLEAGYDFVGTTKYTDRDWGITAKVKMKNAHIDAMGYLPISCDMNLIGSVGVGRLSTKVSLRDDDTATPIVLTAAERRFTKAKTGIRVGLGAEYKFDDCISARVMVRHQKGNKVVKSVNSVGLGLFYTF